jgi:hypothetical protein
MQSPNEPSYQPPIPEPTGQVGMPGAYSGVNDSGTGPTAVLPAELQGFNVGAFLLNWIWAIAHQTWIGLLCLIPCVGFVMAIVLGIKGNEYAWQNRRWESIEQFKATQKIWMYWGIGVIAVSVVLQIVFSLMGAALGGASAGR